VQNMRKRAVFFGAIFILFFFVTVVLFFTHREKITEPTKAITLDTTQLSKFLHDTLEDLLPFQTLKADLHEDGTVRLSASVTKEELTRLLEQYNLPIFHIFLFFSDPIPVQLSFRLQPEKECLSIFLLEFRVSEIDLTGVLNTQLSDALGQLINERLKIQNSKITSFQTIPGGFSIQFRQ